MITVLFEVTLNEGMKEAYLSMASKLSEELAKQEGFISLERFSSIENERKMVSIQTWKDEASIVQWRNNEKHQKNMFIGSQKVFENYSLKILTSLRSYGKYDREQAPPTSTH